VILIVKSPFALMASLVLLSGCGQTGPLYMPHPPARPAASTPPAKAIVPPAPGAGVTPPVGGSNANLPEATTNQPSPAPQQ